MLTSRESQTLQMSCDPLGYQILANAEAQTRGWRRPIAVNLFELI
jgi:hypothetical protein